MKLKRAARTRPTRSRSGEGRRGKGFGQGDARSWKKLNALGVPHDAGGGFAIGRARPPSSRTTCVEVKKLGKPSVITKSTWF